MQRSEHPDGTEVMGWYVRAVRTGPFVFVSGTTSLDPQGNVQGLTAGEQARITLEKIARSLVSAGTGMADVVRMTIFVTDIADGNAVSAEIAKAVTRPIASTLVAVSAFVRPGLLVEIETTAVVGEKR
jgi:enamine deaminase RidA (YjgF/YER057c/UK114 family)